jgi:hypothetical protein
MSENIQQKIARPFSASHPRRHAQQLDDIAQQVGDNIA